MSGTNDLNPIVMIRKYQREESRKEFAEVLGVSENLIMAVEDGELPALPGPVLQGLAAIGCDPEQVQKEYLAWREREREFILRFIRRRTRKGE